MMTRSSDHPPEPWRDLMRDEADAYSVKRSLHVAGHHLGEHCAVTHAGRGMYVVSSVEDADTFAAPFISSLSAEVGYACFWNEEYVIDWNRRGSQRSEEDAERPTRLAPIVHQYVDPVQAQGGTLVVLSSVLNDESTARAHILRMLDEVQPSEVLIVAAVARAEAIESLSREFASARHREWRWLALILDERGEDLRLRPTYVRLGFKSVVEKNMEMPELVRERRRARRPEPSERPKF